MPENTHTKILATIGPASSTKEVLEQLVDAGADAFRFNFSHGTHEEHAERYEQVREIAKAKQRHICIVADLQGPKLRVGQFAKEKVFLKEGARRRKQSYSASPGDFSGNQSRRQPVAK